jgi:hypothetical protein
MNTPAFGAACADVLGVPSDPCSKCEPVGRALLNSRFKQSRRHVKTGRLGGLLYCQRASVAPQIGFIPLKIQTSPDSATYAHQCQTIKGTEVSRALMTVVGGTVRKVSRYLCPARPGLWRSPTPWMPDWDSLSSPRPRRCRTLVTVRSRCRYLDQITSAYIPIARNRYGDQHDRCQSA